MDFAKNEILERRLRAYANVNAFDLAGLKANLEQPGNEAFLATFRAELEEAMSGGVFNIASYEALTGDAYDSEEELLDGLRAMHAYRFEGGPHP